MKLLFVYRFCGLGGVETSILNKVNALNAHGIDGQVLFGDFYGSGGPTLAEDPRVTVGLGKNQVRAFLRRGFDAVSVIDHPDFVDLMDEWEVQSHVLFETHTSLPSSLDKFYSKLNHPRIAAIVVPSQFNKRLVESALYTTKEVVVIPNPIDEQFRPRAPRPLACIPLPSGGPILLWVGRLEDEKNPVEFMKIGEALLKSGFDIRLLIIGDAFSTSEYAAYTERLRTAIPENWTNRFTFCQSVPYYQMPDVYSLVVDTGGCLVSTSLFESAPMTFIEAMSCMCPVVSSDVGGVGELVIDGITGRLYTPGDIWDAAKKIGDLLDRGNLTTRQLLIERGHAVVSERHAPGVAAHQYKTLLESLRAHAPLPIQRQPWSIEDSPAALGSGSVIPGLVSTIIPVYNRPDLLRQAVDSVLSQTYDKIEIIIVDDGSTDGTPALCDQLAQEYSVIRAMHIPHQGRAGLVREVGRLAAKGEYIQYLDSDDLLMPTKFAQMVAALEKNPDCDIAYCYTKRYRIGSVPPDLPAELTGQTFETMLPAFLGRRYWCTSTPLYRRRLCDKAGPWSDLLFWEDIEYDIRLATHRPQLCHCKDWLTDMRDHDFSRLSGSRFLNDPDLLRHAVRGTMLIYQHVRQVGLTYDDEHVRSFIDDVRLIYNRCKDFGLDHEALDCAAIVMDSTGIADPARVGQYSMRALIEPQVGALKALPGQWVSCPIMVANNSTMDFHRGEFPTGLGYHLRDPDGTMRRFDNPTKIFEEPLRPGESRLVDLPIHAPDVSGLYYVEVDILWAGFTWLNSKGNPAGFVKLLVGENIVEPTWWLQLGADNVAEVQFQPGPFHPIRLAIHAATTTIPWHIQLNYGRLPLSANQRYELQFRARADESRRIAVAVSKAHEPWDNLGLYREVELGPEWRTFVMQFTPSATDDKARIHFDAGGVAVSVELCSVALCVGPDGEPVVPPPFSLPGRLQMDIGLKPASYWWGTDRGLAVHRYYLEPFLTEFASDIRGHCVEFQDPQYTPRFGGASVVSLDILHIDDSNSQATLVADLTQPNDLPSNQFDCIICSHVLHVIVDVERAIAELYRILKPGGVLLTAVPHISMYGPEYGEVWRFTPKGLEVLLSRAFGASNVLVRGYGNSLTAAGEIRGVVSSEFLRSELDSHDPRFPVEVCARAKKGG